MTDNRCLLQSFSILFDALPTCLFSFINTSTLFVASNIKTENTKATKQQATNKVDALPTFINISSKY